MWFDGVFENCNLLKYSVFQRGFHRSQAARHERALQQRMLIPLLPFPSAGVMGLHHNAWFMVLGVKPRACKC